MTWFADKLGPAPGGSRAATNSTSRSAPQQAQKTPAAQQKSAAAPQASPQRAAAPQPAPEPDKKKKKGWF